MSIFGVLIPFFNLTEHQPSFTSQTFIFDLGHGFDQICFFVAGKLTNTAARHLPLLSNVQSSASQRVRNLLWWCLRAQSENSQWDCSDALRLIWAKLHQKRPRETKLKYGDRRWSEQTAAINGSQRQCHFQWHCTQCRNTTSSLSIRPYLISSCFRRSLSEPDNPPKIY